VSSVAGHHVTALSPDRSRLSLSLEMRGLVVPLVGRLSRGMIDRYMTTEANGSRRAAEQPSEGLPTSG
jgi:hypothetical protein